MPDNKPVTYDEWAAQHMSIDGYPQFTAYDAWHAALAAAKATAPTPAAQSAGQEAVAWRGLTESDKDQFVGALAGMGVEFAAPLYSIIEKIEAKLRERNAAPVNGGESESDNSYLHAIMERDAWRNAMVGLCNSRDWPTTPDEAADHLRRRLHFERAAYAQHTDDKAVDLFAQAMKAKLADARTKGRGGWETCDPADLSKMLREHVEKGDPRDVANFCMMLWHHRKPISAADAQRASGDLHGEIMNIRCAEPDKFVHAALRMAYRVGHRDARHAAAELVCAEKARATSMPPAKVGTVAQATPVSGGERPPIEYRYEGGTHWCPLGPAEHMKPDFKGVYRLMAGTYPVWQGDEVNGGERVKIVKLWASGATMGYSDYLMSDGSVKTLKISDIKLDDFQRAADAQQVDEPDFMRSHRWCRICKGETCLPGMHTADAQQVGAARYEKVDGCKDCRHAHYYSADRWECLKEKRMFDALGRPNVAPDWCPLPALTSPVKDAQRKPMTDRQIIELCKSVGVEWEGPDMCDFMGDFGRVNMAGMRAIINAAKEQK